uniref:Protein FAR1-RELATED SEQUENCE n=1 Tax=Ananas comosus var. bracteatus TaxID=296719 RepID=A0A6V7PQK3_ANACO|nr:unnamed protein product [Ananas comosus var. bracteatus]
MESTSCDEEGSLRDNNVDLNEENIENHMSLEVSSQLVEADNLFASNQPNSENPEPFVGMEFESEEGAKLFYMAYASRIGFSVRISKSRRSRNDESIIMRRFVCSKEGFHLKKGNFDDGKKKRKRATIREGCNAMIEVIQKYYGRWVVTKLVKEHNHVVAAPSRVRYIEPEEYAHLDPFLGMEFPSHEAAQTFYYAYASRTGFDVRIRLSRRSTRDESFVMRRFVCTKEGFTPSEENYDESKKKRNSRTPTREGCKATFEVIKKDYDKWIVSKLVLEHTHDLAVAPNKIHYIQSQSEVVVLGKSGTLNREKSLLPPLSKPPIGESLGGFNNSPPYDHDFRNERREARYTAFGFDETQSCWWHILNQCKEQLANIYGTSATFEEEFERCIVESESIELFESTWKSVIDKYDLGENSWLRFLYNMRQKWVPVFFKDMFTAEISATQKPESLKFFFEKYFNTTTPLPVFISLFEHAIAGWCEREALEDLATSFTRPVLKTPSNILKQVADVYTRAIFNIFQDEFIHSLGYYVEKIEDGLVSKFNVAKRRIFTDHARHILRVFLTVDVRALPEFYILKRWTKEAKNGFMLDECIRYNELYRDAVRYAKEGSTSADVFNFAQQTLQVAFADVVQMKQDIVNRCAM